MIAMFNAKYHHLFWRPVTAIDPTSVTSDGFGPAPGFDDGNPATVEQAGWSPLIATPNHPEYPSAHSTISSAIVEVLTRFLGTDAIDVDRPGHAKLYGDAALRDRRRPASRGQRRPRLGRSALPLLRPSRLGPGPRGRRLRPQPRLPRLRLERRARPRGASTGAPRGGHSLCAAAQATLKPRSRRARPGRRSRVDVRRPHTTRRRAGRPSTAPGPRPGSSPGVVTRTNGRNGTGRDVPAAKATEALLRRPPARVARIANDGIWVRCGFVELRHYAPASAAPPFACRCGSAAAFGSLLAARPLIVRADAFRGTHWSAPRGKRLWWCRGRGAAFAAWRRWRADRPRRPRRGPRRRRPAAGGARGRSGLDEVAQGRRLSRAELSPSPRRRGRIWSSSTSGHGHSPSVRTTLPIFCSVST